MKYARNGGGHLIDVRDTSPEGCFTAAIVAEFFEVPDAAQDGWVPKGSSWQALEPEPTAPSPAPAVSYPLLQPLQFYMAFTVAEAIAIKAAATQGGAVGEFWDRYERAERTNTMIDPNSGSVVGALNGLVTAKILTADRVPQIQAGVAQ